MSKAARETSPETTIPEWTLGDRLRKVRERAGVSVSEIAAELTRNRNTVGNWESGRTVPTDAVVRRWALRFQTPYSWLKTGQVQAPDNDPEQVLSNTTWIADRAVTVVAFRRRSSSDTPLAHERRAA